MEANDTEGGWRKGEQYTKGINTPRTNATVITTYPSNKAMAQIELVGWAGWKTWRGMVESAVGSVAAVVVDQSQKDHLSRTSLSAPSEVNCGWSLRRFRTEAVAADEGDAAGVRGSPFDASASGSNHQNLRGVR